MATEPQPTQSESRIVTVTDDVVERLTWALCGDTMAIINTLRGQDQRGYLDRMYARTRKALEDVADD